MIDQPLAEAYVHRRHNVMWRRLRPLTMRRFFALLIAENPLLDASHDVHWGDLECAVTICAIPNPIQDFNRLSRLRSLRGRFLRWCYPHSIEFHARKFTAYLNDYHAVPESTSTPGSKLAKAPWILRIVETLRRNGYQKRWFHLWHDPAWDMETGQAFHLYATMQELDGAETNLLDPEEKELLRLARDAAAARDAATLTPEAQHG